MSRWLKPQIKFCQNASTISLMGRDVPIIISVESARVQLKNNDYNGIREQAAEHPINYRQLSVHLYGHYISQWQK